MSAPWSRDERGLYRPSGGCACTSCRETNKYIEKGFADWPRGNPSGRKSASEYAAHVSFGKRTADRFVVPSLDPVAFYGRPRGMSAREVNAVLRRSFGLEEQS